MNKISKPQIKTRFNLAFVRLTSTAVSLSQALVLSLSLSTGIYGGGRVVVKFCCCCCEVTSVVSDSEWPHRQQPTRLPCPWESPGKNTGVGCHFLLQCMKVKSEREFAQSCLTLRDPMDCSLPGSFVHGIFQARVLEWGAIAFSRTINLFNH